MDSVDEKKDVIEYFDEFKDYGVYYRGPWKYYRKEYVRIIVDQFKNHSGVKVLDLGCGRMCSLPDLLNEDFVSVYHCIDASQESLNCLKSSFLNSDKIKIQASDVIEYLNTAMTKFDIVIFFGVLMYLPREKMSQVVLQAEKLLNPNGLLVIHEPNERAGKYLDEHSAPLSDSLLQNMLSYESWKENKVANYNITILRKPVFFVFKALRKIKKITSIRVKIIDRFFQVFETCIWRLEFFIEKLFSAKKIGCDSMVILKKKEIS